LRRAGIEDDTVPCPVAGITDEDGEVPVGHVLGVALLAFCTATAVLGPRPARTTQNYWGFWVTFLINEMPFLAFSCVDRGQRPGLRAGRSHLARRPGRVRCRGVLTAAGLVVLVRRALPTGAVLRRALAADAGVELPPVRWPWAHILLAPFAVRRRDVVRVANLAYGDGDKRNLLDVYHRRDRPLAA
jgi:hypothetical protein